MRLLSKIFEPLITIPKGGKINNEQLSKSQKLLLENGLVRSTSDGFFGLLPSGQRALDKLEQLLNHHMDKMGAQKMSLPNLMVSRLSKASQRLQNMGPELFKLEDRHKNKYFMAPPHEEAIVDLLSEKPPISHKQLPLLLYQISNKYKDVDQPQNGLLHAREFGMLDVYSFHADEGSVLASYEQVTKTFKDIFVELNLPVHRVEASNCDKKEKLSHEWQLLAATGEDWLQMCPSCSHTALATNAAQTETICVKCGGKTEKANSIQVGHTFILGSGCRKSSKVYFVNSLGATAPLAMASYNIGTTRLLAASIESLSSDKKIRWPRVVAPYSVILIGPKEDSKEWDKFGSEKVLELGRAITEAGFDVVVDDRHTLAIGKRYMMADNMGYPYVVICGRKTQESPPRFELHKLYPGKYCKPEYFTLDELIAAIKESDQRINRVSAAEN